MEMSCRKLVCIGNCENGALVLQLRFVVDALYEYPWYWLCWAWIGLVKQGYEGVLAWRETLAELQERLGQLFVRPEPRQQAGRYLEGLLSSASRKNGWGAARFDETAGCGKLTATRGLKDERRAGT